MKSSLIALTASALPMLMNATLATAAEPQLNLPATQQARSNAEALRRTARAFYELSRTDAHRTKEQEISQLWLFPTADIDTVFAQYTLSGAATGQAAREHLVVLTMDGDHIVASRELTPVDGALRAESAEPGRELHWSASIGTGRAAGELPAASVGTPSSPDWTARIGSGRSVATSSVAETVARQASAGTPSLAETHWSSKIGTGRVAESAPDANRVPRAKTLASL